MNNDLPRLLDWLNEPNREPAQTKFTAGELRNVARLIEQLICKATNLANSCV